jgi:hypothetical protein
VLVSWASQITRARGGAAVENVRHLEICLGLEPFTINEILGEFHVGDLDCRTSLRPEWLHLQRNRALQEERTREALQRGPEAA